MQAQVGHWLVVHGRTLDAPVREGLIVGVPHADGSPPYEVRWTDDERTSLVFPGADTTVVPHPPHGAGSRARTRTR
ncbi:DUF1918 domain-containing protein [Trujillonella endophytica]|uniref:DUF1918 domain-containing protein n=1 Tax=Trujillonella endophytica TaxID=673521 RepID=A0A1H8SZS6_9ACTN|nr:DUF1918 domain-containing protein [Trujillella endophytica]SEO84162.1 protein of unknown function [Trujillella endophytica]